MIPGLAPHLGAATLLRISAEGIATALVLTVQARTGHAATAGYVQTAMTLPYVLSGPVIGHAIDRTTRPRRTALALAAAYAASTAALLATVGRVPLVLALGVAAVIGCTEPVVVAVTGLLPRFVPAGRLSRAYGLEASSYNLAAVAGPGLAAAVAAYAGGSYAGAVIVAASTLGALALPLLPFPPRRRPTPPSPSPPPPRPLHSLVRLRPFGRTRRPERLRRRGRARSAGGRRERREGRGRRGRRGRRGWPGRRVGREGSGRGGGGGGRRVEGARGGAGAAGADGGDDVRVAGVRGRRGHGRPAGRAPRRTAERGRAAAGGHGPRVAARIARVQPLAHAPARRTGDGRRAGRVRRVARVAGGGAVADVGHGRVRGGGAVGGAGVRGDAHAAPARGAARTARGGQHHRRQPQDRRVGARAALTAASADLVGPVGLVLTIAGFQFAGAAIGAVLLRRPES
ncbi:MFS transporter [Actinomadura sp. J1-007]|nr:MFS transporter [Actinomadura sp. J1-007]